MRPARFQDFTLDLVKNSSDATHVQTLAEAGDSKHPRGLAITTTAGEARWQIVGQLAVGEKHTDPDTPVTDEPFRTWTEPKPGDHEGWFAAALARAESPEIANIERWSIRPGQQDKPGLTVFFHNGAKVFIRQL